MHFLIQYAMRRIKIGRISTVKFGNTLRLEESIDCAVCLQCENCKRNEMREFDIFEIHVRDVRRFIHSH